MVLGESAIVALPYRVAVVRAGRKVTLSFGPPLWYHGCNEKASNRATTKTRPKTNGQGHIQVRFEKQGHDFMRCVVEDNGIGRKKSAQLSKGAKLKEHESKGMQITADRIDILNLQKKKLAKLEIIDLFDETQQPTGTRIVLHIPLLMNDEL